MTTITADHYFAVITARNFTVDGDERTHVQTCGHRDPNCRAIQPASDRLPTSTLAQHLENNEWFDGEVVFLVPFRCHVCHDLCRGGTCHGILDLCSKHSMQYQRQFGRAANE